MLAFGTNLSLNHTQYRIHAFLGSGAIADSYMAMMTDTTGLVVIRLPHRNPARIEQTQALFIAEAQLLSTLNQLEDPAWPVVGSPQQRYHYAAATLHLRRVIGLLDSGTDGLGSPFIVQELAPASFQPPAVRNLADELRAISVATAVAETIELCHAAGIALRDFDPLGEKSDRIRVALTSEGHVEHVKLIDWNVVGGREHYAQDLLFLGGHLYSFLFGVRPRALSSAALEVRAWVPVSTTWQQISAGSRQIVARLLHSEPTERYPDARTLRTDLAWWRDTLQVTEAAALEQRARAVTDPRQRLAVSELALRRFTDQPAQATFEAIRHKALTDLADEQQRSVDRGLLNLHSGLYQQARTDFRQADAAAATIDAVAWEAQLYLALTELALQLKTLGVERPRDDPQWQAAHHAVEALCRGNAEQALALLAPLDIPNDGGGAVPLQRLQLEATRLHRQAQAVAHLQAITASLPGELTALGMPLPQMPPEEVAPHFGTSLRPTPVTLGVAQYHRLRRELAALLERYERAATLYRTIKQAFDQWSTTPSDRRPADGPSSVREALTMLAGIVAELADHHHPAVGLVTDLARWQQQISDAFARSEARHKEVTRANRLLADSVKLITMGELEAGLDLIHAAQAVAPDIPELEAWQALVSKIAILRQQSAERIPYARRQITEGDYEAAVANLGALFTLEAQASVALAEVGIASLTAEQAVSAFVTTEARGLYALATQATQIAELAHAAYDQQRYGKASETTLQMEQLLATMGFTLPTTLAKLRQRARQRQQQVDAAAELLAQARFTPDSQKFQRLVAQVADLIGSDRSVAARQMRSSLVMIGLERLGAEDDLQQAAESARLLTRALPEGMEHEALNRTRYLLDQALNVDQLLPTADDQHAPAWLEEPNWLTTYKRLRFQIEQLLQGGSQLPAITLRATTWPERQQQLAAQLVTHAIAQIAEAGQAALQAKADSVVIRSRLGAALTATLTTWEQLTEALHQEAPQQLLSDWTEQIAALKLRAQADATWVAEGRNLTPDWATLPAAVSRLAALALPEHPDVPVADLRQHLHDLQSVARAITLLSGTHADTTVTPEFQASAEALGGLDTALAAAFATPLIAANIVQLREQLKMVASRGAEDTSRVAQPRQHALGKKRKRRGLAAQVATLRTMLPWSLVGRWRWQLVTAVALIGVGISMGSLLAQPSCQATNAQATLLSGQIRDLNTTMSSLRLVIASQEAELDSGRTRVWDTPLPVATLGSARPRSSPP